MIPLGEMVIYFRDVKGYVILEEIETLVRYIRAMDGVYLDDRHEKQQQKKPKKAK